MPATIRYKSGYPSAKTPVETRASVAADGLITGSAVFIVTSTAKNYPVNSSIDHKLFSSLRGVDLQGLFVESRTLEKVNGLYFLRLGVVGALNPPVFQTTLDISPRGFSKSATSVDEDEESITRTLSFDYIAETYSVSTVMALGNFTEVPVPDPVLRSVFNRRGQGIILSTQEEGVYDQQGGNLPTARPRILTNETREERAGIIRINKSKQFVYE